MAQFKGLQGTLRYDESSSSNHGLAKSEAMTCKSCASESPLHFGADLVIHFPSREGLDKPAVRVLPKLLVCMNCGFTEFAIPQSELKELASSMRKSEASPRQENTEDVGPGDPKLHSKGPTTDPRGGGSGMKD
jgi:hypothetical protein